MERPKGTMQPIAREITGEIAYLNDMRRLGEPAREYPGDLSDMAIQLYEEEAAIMRDRGIIPDIFAQYEHYDTERSDELSRSCSALAEALLALKEPDSTWTFENFIVQLSPQEVLDKLSSIRAGELLATSDEQLAIPSNGEYYPILDVKKSDMVLDNVGVRVWGWSDRKYVFTNKPGEKYDYAKDCLVYPSTEKSRWYELDISFGYTDTDRGYVDETVLLYIGTAGDVAISSNVWMSAYAETGYEGHNRKSLDDASDEDIAAFADLIAGIVGDEPEAVWHYNERQLTTFIDTIDDEVSQEYLREWVDNTFPTHVMNELATLRFDDVRLVDGLRASEPRAYERLRQVINNERTVHNNIDGESLIGKSLEPWRDRVHRED